jgi:hypothetical protein
MAAYFSGTRNYEPFLVIDGDDRVACNVSEYWSNMDQDITVMCGATEESETERTVGISRKEYLSLETTLKGSLGVKGLASLGTELRERVGSEIEFNEATTRTTKHKIAAPTCGTCSYVFYQLIRIFEFKVPRTRPWPFKACVSTRTFIEKTRNFAIREERIEFDPQCGCDGGAGPKELRLVDAVMGNLKVRTDAETNSDGSITAYLGGRAVTIASADQTEIELDLTGLPSFIAEMAGWPITQKVGVAQLYWPPPQETETPELFGVSEAVEVAEASI